MTVFWIVLGAMLVIALVYLAIGYKAFSSFAMRGKQGKHANLRHEGSGDFRRWVLQQSPERLTLKNREALTLFGYLLRAEKPRGCTVLLLHGYLGNGLDHMGMFVPFYLEQGFDVFLPDLRAHGDSEGRYIGFGKTDADDCVEWCRYLRTLYDEQPCFLLHGVSMGGATACTAAGLPTLPDSVRGVVSDCAFSSCEEQFSHTLKHLVSLSPKLILPVANLFCKAMARYDLYEASATKAIVHSRLPFLFIHGKEDRFVPTHMVNTLYDACPSPDKTRWIVPEAKHFESYLLAKEEYQERLLSFFDAIGV